MADRTLLHSFVDESGDDGFSPASTEWLVISAVVLGTEYLQKALSEWEACKTLAGRRPQDRLHWNKLSHGARKAVLQRLNQMPITVVSILAHKRSFTPEQVYRLKCPTLYFFQTKLLVERLSWLARDLNTRTHITFEDRPQVSPKELKEYIFDTLRKPGRNTQIAYDNIDGFNAKKHTQQTQLEIADAVAGAVGNGLNPDRYGQVETSYAISLLPKMWIRGGSLYSYGLKVIPPVQLGNFELFRRIEEERKKK